MHAFIKNMGSLEKKMPAASQASISSLDVTESKKLRVQKAILSLLVEWKDLDNHVDSSKTKFLDLEEKERHLNFLRNSVIESTRILNDLSANMEVRREEVEVKEKEFRLFLENESRELGLKKRLVKDLFERFEVEKIEFERLRDLVGEKLEEIRVKEKCIANRESEFEVREMEFYEEMRVKEKCIELREMEVVKAKSLNEEKRNEFEIKMEKLELEEKLVEERSKAFELKEKHLKERVKGIEMKEKDLDNKLKELDSREKRFKQCGRSVGFKGKGSDSSDVLCEEKRRELEVREKQLDKQLKEFEMKEKYFKEWVKSNDLKEKEMDSMKISLDERFKDLESKEKKLESCLKEFDELKDKHFKELELREKQVRDQLKEFELKEKKFSNTFKSLVKSEPLEDDPSYADIRFNINMDGKGLLVYLVERERDLHIMTDEVTKALMMSKDPAKLVLDATEGFHVSSLKKGDKEFGSVVIRNCCILLLEQLKRISPKIQPHVKAAALKRAGEWKEKMITGVESYLELSGWLQLLGCYGLASDFEPGELLNVFEVFGQQGQIPELCKLLGYTQRVSDLVSCLVNAKQHVMAVRYVCAFGLNEKFQPATLLQDFFKQAEEKSKTLDTTEAIHNILTSLNDALRCISSHKLESEFPPNCVELLIELLIKQKENLKLIAPDSPGNARKQQHIERNYKSEKTVSLPTKACTIPLKFEAIGSVSELANAMAVILADMDEKSLNLILSEHFKDQNFKYLGDTKMAMIRNLVGSKADFIRSASDPAKLILDALQGCYHSNLGKGKNPSVNVIMSFCTILENLLIMSPQIKPCVKEAATKFALEWKARLPQSRSNSFEVLGFIHLLIIYKVVSSIDADELLGLFHIVGDRKKAPKLFHLLHLAHKISDFVESLVRKDERLQAVRYIYAFEIADKFPPVPLLKDHLAYAREHTMNMLKQRRNSTAAIGKAIRKELAAVKAVINYVRSHGLVPEYPTQLLFARMKQLKTQQDDLNKGKTPAYVLQTQQNQENSIKEKPKPSAIALPAPGLAQPNKNHPTRDESRNSIRKRRFAASQDLDPQAPKHFQHFNKRPRVEPLAETAINAYPAELVHQPPQLHAGPYTKQQNYAKQGHYGNQGQTCATYNHTRHYSLGNWNPSATPHAGDHFKYMPSVGYAKDHFYDNVKLSHYK